MSHVVDEAELAWRKQQQETNGGVEPTEGDEEEDDEEAERLWQMMQEQLVKVNEEAQKLAALREQNELSLSTADDDDGIYKGELTIPFDSLVFEKEIGGGNFGKIFKGDFLGTEVAIKKFAFEEDAKYVEREVGVLKAIRHPNIVTFLGVCQNQSELYVVTEWVSKGDLTHELQTDKPISWRQRVLYAKDACAAVAYLHQLGIIHRDIKPDNLLITDNGRIKVCDLGFARTAKRMKRMSIAGTGLYMAPEVMIGEQYDLKCDVFSFGACLYELITRKPPPQRHLDSNFHFDFGELRALIPADCPEDFLDLCFECLMPTPEERPVTREIIPRLSQLLTVLPHHESDDVMTEEERRLEEEAEKAFLAEAEKSLKENQKFLEAVKEIEEEAKLTPEALELAKKEMEQKMKEEIEKEVEQRLREEKARLREEMKKELEKSKAQLTASMSTGEMRHMLSKMPKDGGQTLKRTNSWTNLGTIRQAREDIKKEEKMLKQEDKELKKEERALLQKEEKQKKSLFGSKKKRKEEIARARQSWGPSRGKKEKGENGNSPNGKDEPNGKAHVPNAEIKKDATSSTDKKKKESKEEKKAREKEEKKEKERLKKEKKEKEKQEKQTRAVLKKKKVSSDRTGYKKDDKKALAKGIHKSKSSPEHGEKVLGEKEKTPTKLTPNREVLTSSPSSLLYG